MYTRVVILVVGLAACSRAESGSGDSAAVPDTPPTAAPVSLAEFQQIGWLAGQWLGSGGAYPAFYEEYRIVDDSTIQMRSYPDSTFTNATDSSWIELRGGEAPSRGADNRTSVVIALAADSVRFAGPGMNRGGHTFTRQSADEWTAVLHPQNAGGQPTVYTMRRIRR